MTKRAWEASSSSQEWLPEVLPEYTIFLSHSGHDKPFVERLCEELKRLNYSPFFDQNSDSLPKGERFPPHLFKAAEQCLLAVIVLSEGYLTSKWPMLELAAFVKAKETRNPTMKLLPLFYKLSPSDLIVENWLDSWEKLVADGKIHAKEIELWSKGVEVLMTPKNVETKKMKSLIEHDDQDEIMHDDFLKLLPKIVHDLCPFNGLEFSKYGTSEGRYIQAVVDEIHEIILPTMKYNIDGIRGYQRMCEKTALLFEEGSLINDVCKPGCFYLGLYGMGGVGKTTLCGAMCSFHQVKFRSRVCHVELGNDTGDEKLERLKYVIRQLGGLDDRIVEKITSKSQGLQCLQDRLKSLPPTFLVIDNVGDSESSRDEAQSFIKSIFACPGSKVMVTSRSRIILESILREAKYCKPIPRLKEQEAKELFLSVAIPQKMLSLLPLGEDEIVKTCVRDCQFVDDGYVTHQYHPLVLRALGTFFHDVDKDDIMKWKKALKSNKKLQLSRELKSVNDILGLNYARLSDELKLLFMDVALFFNLKKFWLLHVTRKDPRKDDYKWEISLIATMHGISTFDAKMKVKELQRKSLIYECGHSLRIHDLYIEFVLSMLGKGGEGMKENQWWIGQRNANGYNPMVKRIFLLKDASIFCPKELGGCLPKELWGCLNLECLIIGDCKATLEPKLDLESFPNLRLLILYTYVHNLNPTYFSIEIFCGQKYESRGGLPKLLRVQLCGFDLRNLTFLKHCQNLTFLSIKDCLFDILDFTLDGTSLLENLKALETLILSSSDYSQISSCIFDGILYNARNLKSLKYLEIDFTWIEVHPCKLNLSPLRSLISLQRLSLPSLPFCIEELIGLDQLSQLMELNLESSFGLRKLPNLRLLPNLQQICVESCFLLTPQEDQFKCFQKFHIGGKCLYPRP